MAERTVARARCWPVPEGVDDATAAALPNPALSSWLPLTWRAQLAAGETVVILGATGVAGKLAIQIAKLLGAGRVVAAGRNDRALSTLGDLGADAVIHLEGSDLEVTQAFAREAGEKGYQVIVDYLRGHPTELLLAALTRSEFSMKAAGRRLIPIGESAGPAIAGDSRRRRTADEYPDGYLPSGDGARGFGRTSHRDGACGAHRCRGRLAACGTQPPALVLIPSGAGS